MFKTIAYAYLLYESARNFFAVNKQNKISLMYKYCLCIVNILQPVFDLFHSWRIRKKIIAGCKWQIGQLTNVLNYLFDTNNITITQAKTSSIFAPTINYESTVFAPTINYESDVFAPTINNNYFFVALVTFNVPSSLVNDKELISVIEQIKPAGIDYNIISL